MIPLRGLKVHQIRPHQSLGDLVPRHGGHGVAHDAAVPADGNVGRPGADIHQTQIQKPQLGGDGGVERRNGFQGQALHIQAHLAP